MASFTLLDENENRLSIQEIQEKTDSVDEEPELVDTIRFEYQCPYCEAEQVTEYSNFIPNGHTVVCNSCQNGIPITEKFHNSDRVFIYPSEALVISNNLNSMYQIGNLGRNKADDKIYNYITESRKKLLSGMIGGYIMFIFSFSALMFTEIGTQIWLQPFVYFGILFGVGCSVMGLYYEYKIKTKLPEEVTLKDLLRYRELYESIYTT